MTRAFVALLLSASALGAGGGAWRAPTRAAMPSWRAPATPSARN